MKQVWNITLDDYLEIVKIAMNDGCKPGESLEPYLIDYMKQKGRKPSGHTELTKEELIKEYNSHGQNVIDLTIDKEGKSKYTFNKGE